MTPLPDTEALQSASAADLQQGVTQALTRQIFDRARLSNWLGAPFAALVCVLLWDRQAHSLLIGWMLAKLAVFAWRVLLDRAQLRATPARAGHWLRHHQWAHLADGLVYSGLGTWLVPDQGSPVGILLVATTIGVAAVGFVALCSHFGTLMAFVLPVIVPMVVQQLWLGTSLGRFAGLAGALFLVIMVLDGWRASRATEAALRDHLQLDSLAAQRQAALALAQQHSAVKSRFLATMSHEMRTPLHGLLGITRLLQADGGQSLSPAERTRQLRVLEHTGEHLLTLISDVLDFSRIETGSLTLQPAPFDLAALLAEVSELTQLSARDKGLTVVLDSPLRSPCWVIGDQARLRQVLLNLTGNAVKFTEHGAVTLRLARSVDALVCLSVADTGPGIPPDELDQVFEAFHQADGSSRRRHGGTGLGLTLARQLVRLMGGELDCSSTPGQGACFTLQLPMPEVAPPAPEPVRQTTPPRLAGRVLLVEDNPVNAMVAEAMLSRAGLEVETVTDGLQAVNQVRRQRYDVVLMDCQMPVLDGIAATRRIRQDEGQLGSAPLTIVGLTANATEDDRQACLAAGMNDYLAKPFRDVHLQGVLSRYLRVAGS